MPMLGFSAGSYDSPDKVFFKLVFPVRGGLLMKVKVVVFALPIIWNKMLVELLVISLTMDLAKLANLI